MKEPSRCAHPACGKWTWKEYCQDHERERLPAAVLDTIERGVGAVVPPRKVKYTRPRRVRRSEGYIASNGAWIAIEPAPYLEFAKDVGRRHKTRDARGKRHVAKSAGMSYAERLARFGATNNGNPDA
jgi:hypothetical protein